MNNSKAVIFGKKSFQDTFSSDKWVILVAEIQIWNFISSHKFIEQIQKRSNFYEMKYDLLITLLC
jgi:hypothetical protein